MGSSGCARAVCVANTFGIAGGGYGRSWDDSSFYNDWAAKGVAANVACRGCGGDSTATTLSPASAPRCTDTPGDWRSSLGIARTDCASKAYCAADSGHGNGWDDNSILDEWTTHVGATNVVCMVVAVARQHRHFHQLPTSDIQILLEIQPVFSLC